MKRLLALALLLPLAGCGAPSTAVTPAVPAAASAAASTAPSASPPSTVDNWANAVKFSELVLGNKHDQARPYASPGSPADRYVTHQIAGREAIAAGGGPATAKETPTVNAEAHTVSFPSGDEEAVWKDFTYDADGKVTGWTLAGTGTTLASRMWTKDAQATVKGVTVKLVSAYQNDSGLFVILDITSADRDLQSDPQPSLTDTKKRQRQSASFTGPTSVTKGNSAYMLYFFPDATFGGTLTYKLLSSSYSSVGSVVLTIE